MNLSPKRFLERSSQRAWLGCALAASVLATLWPARAIACSCMPAGTPSEASAQAHAVFEGRVLQVREQTPEGPLVVRLQVVRAWKGVTSESLELTTARDSAACGYEFKPEQSYLVYASQSNGTLDVSLCSRTRPMSEADEDLRALGMGATPVDPKPPASEQVLTEGKAAEPARGGCASCSIGARGVASPFPAALAAGALLAFATCRRRSRSRS